jgi:hypothetical protein
MAATIMISSTFVDALRHVNRFCQIRKGLKMKKDTTEFEANACSGKLIKVSGDKLTSACEKGDERDYAVAKGVKVTCDGKEVKLSDPKSGTAIRMTMSKADRNKILAVECGKHL